MLKLDPATLGLMRLGTLVVNGFKLSVLYDISHTRPHSRLTKSVCWASLTCDIQLKKLYRCRSQG